MSTAKSAWSLSGGAAGARESATDLYLITILGLFPLFPGFSGYGKITAAKLFFFLAATGLWLVALAVLSFRERGGRGALGAAGWAAAVFLGLTALSWLCSPWRRESLLGAGRYDGLFTTVLYALVFLGVSRMTRPKLCHAAALAAGAGLNCALGILQLCGRNPLGLFPLGLGYYDSGLYYSGSYLSAIGNTNILDAVLALALPLCAGLWLLRGEWLWLLPVPFMGFVILRAGGGGMKAALLAAGLIGMPLLLTERKRVRRGLGLLSLGCVTAALALAFHPDYVGRSLRLSLSFGLVPLVLLPAAGVLLALSLCPWPFREPSVRTHRILFSGLAGLCLLGGLLLIWFWPGEGGTFWELRETLRGRADEGFGSSRIRIWRACLELVPERFWLGGGPGTLALRLDIRFSRTVEETGVLLQSYVDNAHNVYLGELVNGGLLGLLSELALFGLSLWNALRRKGLYPAFALALIGGLVHAFFGLGLCVSEPVFWVILGLCAAKEEPK